MFERKKTYSVTPFQNGCETSTEITAYNPDIRHNALTTAEPPDKHRFCKMNFRPYLGFAYCFLSSFFIILSSVMVKKLTYISPGQLSMIRNMGVLMGNLPIAVYSVDQVLGPRKHWPVLCIRSFLGATALYLNLLAYRYLPLAMASIIMSTAPALVTVAARFYLKEPCGIIQSGAIALTVIGMLLSIQLPDLLQKGGLVDSNIDTSSYVVGICCALGCVVILSFTYVSLRKLVDIHFSVIQLYFGVLGTMENAILTASFSNFSAPRCGWDTVQVVMVAATGFAGHSLLTLAIQAEAAGIVSVLRSSSDIVVSMVFQVIFFDLVPGLYNFVGAILVIFSVSTIGFRKYLSELPADCNRRKRFRYLLL